MAETLAGNACTGSNPAAIGGVVGAGLGATLDELKDMPGVARGAMAVAVGSAASGLVASLGMIAGAAIVSNPVGWCIGIGAIVGIHVGGVVGLVCKSSPGRNGGAAGGAIGGAAAHMTANTYNGRPCPGILARG